MRLAELCDEKRASAARRRPASALAGTPIVTPTRRVPGPESERVRDPRMTKSPCGTISTSSLSAWEKASGIGIETTWKLRGAPDAVTAGRVTGTSPVDVAIAAFDVADETEVRLATVCVCEAPDDATAARLRTSATTPVPGFKLTVPSAIT